MNWKQLSESTPPEGIIKVKDNFETEAYAHACDRGQILEIITDGNDHPVLGHLTHYRLVKECTLKLFKGTI